MKEPAENPAKEQSFKRNERKMLEGKERKERNSQSLWQMGEWTSNPTSGDREQKVNASPVSKTPVGPCQDASGGTRSENTAKRTLTLRLRLATKTLNLKIRD